jgi:GT2 family glycosyltransferase
MDRRLLSVFFRVLEFRHSGNFIKTINLYDPQFFSRNVLFGFWNPEESGVWSNGKKCALVLESQSKWPRNIDLTIEGHCFGAAFLKCSFTVKTSEGHIGSGFFFHTLSKILIKLKRPIWPRSRQLVVGNFKKMLTAKNVSNYSINPCLSIILVNLNKPRLTRLAAISASSSGIQQYFEILVLDNGSSAEILADLQNVEVPMRIFPQEKNLGFGLANNLAVAEARGKYILFLNNDAFLQPGCVEELLKCFDIQPDCAAVGPLLRWPDGTLQEAGCGLQPDGYPIRHGRGDIKFNKNTLKRYQPVEYISGACLMMRRSDFLEVGGFDPIYSPAYYEDTDLCMRLREKGKAVYLASRAECYHIENATSHSIESAEWATRQSEKNRLIFLERWSNRLSELELINL